jgi:hypothetical protein
MLERSRALEASERSIAASMTSLVWGNNTKLEQGRNSVWERSDDLRFYRIRIRRRTSEKFPSQWLDADP